LIQGYGAGGWKLAQNDGQTILWDAGGVAGTNQTTTGTGGNIASTDRYDCVEVRCAVTDTTWVVGPVKGEITIV
jgi:hypothetical protein